MRRMVFIGSHLGYPMERTPLGGGAMVGLNLARTWAEAGGFEVTALGAGAQSPAPGVDYVRLGGEPGAGAPDLVGFSEMEYARFCRRFERETTRWLLERTSLFPPESTAVVVNDISEAPDLEALWRAGYRPATLWHVDVADYFCRMYLRGAISTAAAIRFYERLGGADLVPDVLKLVFDKQRRAMRFSARMIFPSRAMAEVARNACADVVLQAQEFAAKARVIPWGAWGEGPREPSAAAVERLKDLYQIRPESLVLMTLSRLSPEKGVEHLLEALLLLERLGEFRDKDACVLVCGAPAFMRGEAYARRVRAAAQKLRRVRAFFPGYLGPEDKRAFFCLASLFVSPSVHESYGLNAMEAMRAGLPVLALEHYGSRDWPGGFAYAVPPKKIGGAPEALAAGLKQMLSDPRGLEALGRQAAAYAAARPFSAAARAVAEEAFSAVGGKPAPILK